MKKLIPLLMLSFIVFVFSNFKKSNDLINIPLETSQKVEEQIPFLPEFEESLLKSNEEKKPILLYFYGWDCKNVLESNEMVFNNKHVKKLIHSNYIFLPLNISDRTPLAGDEIYRSEQFDILIKTKGHRNVDFEISKFDKNMQPYFVTLNQKGQTLSSSEYMNDPATIINFLKNGVNIFNRN